MVCEDVPVELPDGDCEGVCAALADPVPVPLPCWLALVVPLSDALCVPVAEPEGVAACDCVAVGVRPVVTDWLEVALGLGEDTCDGDALSEGEPVGEAVRLSDGERVAVAVGLGVLELDRVVVSERVDVPLPLRVGPWLVDCEGGVLCEAEPERVPLSDAEPDWEPDADWVSAWRGGTGRKGLRAASSRQHHCSCAYLRRRWGRGQPGGDRLRRG